MRPTGPLRKVIKASLSAKAVLCAVVAGALLASGCGSAPGQVPTARRPVTSTVRHWGAFFGGAKGVNYDLATSPAAVTVPGIVVRGRDVQLDRVRAAVRRQPLRLGPGHAGPARGRPRRELLHPAGAGALPRGGEDRVDTRRRHALRHRPGRRHQGQRLGLGPQRRGRALPGEHQVLPHPGPAPAAPRDGPGRGQQPRGVRRWRHRLRVRAERRRRPGRRQQAQQHRRRCGWPGSTARWSPGWWPRSPTPGRCCPTASTSTGATTATASSATGTPAGHPTSRSW